MLTALHERELSDQGYYWPDESLPRPGTLAELHELLGDEANELLADSGTHSILDVYRVLPPGEGDEFGSVLPLPIDEVRQAFDTDRPTRDQFEAVFEGGVQSLTTDLFPGYSGRFTTLFDGDTPTETVIWGYSGD